MTAPRIARQEALAKGNLRYLGTPCRYGHSGLRYASGGGCLECRPLKDARKRQKRAGLPEADMGRQEREAARQAKLFEANQKHAAWIAGYAKTPIAVKTEEIIVSKNIPQADLKPGMCKAVVGHTSNFDGNKPVCCGADVVAGTQWCADHTLDVSEAMGRLERSRQKSRFGSAV